MKTQFTEQSERKLLSEFISTSALKFSLKILVHLTSRDTIDNIAPRVNIPKISLIFLGYASGLIRTYNLCRTLCSISYVLIKGGSYDYQGNFA